MGSQENDQTEVIYEYVVPERKWTPHAPPFQIIFVERFTSKATSILIQQKVFFDLILALVTDRAQVDDYLTNLALDD